MHAVHDDNQASTGDPVSLVVAIPTFKRPDRLVRTLDLVGAQVAPLASDGRVSSASILVIDNDPAESARGVVDDSYHGVRTRYVAEATPGIPAVRNRALDESADIRLLSFIDDDEVPLEGWISSLLETWSTTGRPAAVMGRVVSLFDPDADPWVLESGLFRRPQRRTGAEIAVAATGNLLLDLSQVRRSGVRFDQRIGLGGGSDTLFSMGLKKTGARLVWCNESVAEDAVEPERQTRPWALKRSFSHGNVSVLVQLRLEPRSSRRALIRVKGVVGGAARVVAGFGRHLYGRLSRSVRHDARGLRLVYRGAGMISASVGQTYSAYSRPGSSA
ncbi:glycosyltransferase family 2 protein [Microbacterium sp. CR_7]|uniref:glycosyltransferase family 2 protein n=1 Tax=Microbacterium sp. CR_7 TaxID=3055792 RepID=UPI0035C0B4E6